MDSKEIKEPKIPKEDTDILKDDSNTPKDNPNIPEDDPNISKNNRDIPKNDPNRIYIDGVRWFTYKQLAVILHCTPQSVYNNVRTGKIKTKKIDGISFYRLDEYM